MTRHDARILALRALFCWNVGNIHPADGFDYLVTEATVGIAPDSENIEYARNLTETSVSKAKEIDKAINEVSVGWTASRMPRVDLSILRLAYAEAVIIKGAPVEVVLNEAIELAKEFGSYTSPKFVNGVLMGIFRKMGWSKESEERYNN